MRIGWFWLIPWVVAVMSAACAQEPEQKPVLDPGPLVATAEPDHQGFEAGGPDSQHEAAIPTAADIQSAREQLGELGGGSGFYPNPGLPSLEEVMLGSEVIARVDYLRNQGSVVYERGWWLALLEFRFRVHEYLKGSGPDEIGAFIVAGYRTEADAQRATTLLADAHDAQWDDREAIVFLNYPGEIELPDHQLGAGQYWLDDVGGESEGYIDSYSVASRWRKLWLPEATQTTQTGARGASTSGQSSETTTTQLFMLDVPAGGAGASGGARSASNTGGGPTISLSDLKSRISALEAEANAGGTTLYRECVELYYRDLRDTRQSIAIHGQIKTRYSISIDSGLPADTVVKVFPDSSRALSAVSHGRKWYEGPDKDVMRFKNVNFVTSTRDVGYYDYDTQLVTARPLPTGAYTLYPNWLSVRHEPCGKDWSFKSNRRVVSLTVTAPPRTLHEAFFDPVDIGSAVGADSSNGVLKPNAFSLNNTNTTISSLKWEDGAVTMTLSPTASLADYAIDFIDVTGITTLSLTSDNASTTALTWTVPDKPWAAGDLLMLRIHKPVSNDATLSALALSGVDLAFSPATTTYTASVPATTTQTTVTPTANHASATYVVKLGGVVDDDGTIPLAAGANVITIDVTAEDAVTTRTYSVTVTRATPSEPITVTLSPRVEGSETYVNLTIEWDDPGACDGQYMVALYITSDYLVTFMGFHPAPATTSLSRETYLWWDLRFFPDRWAGVSCDPSDYSGRRELGRASLRAAHPDNN